MSESLRCMGERATKSSSAANDGANKVISYSVAAAAAEVKLIAE